MSTELAKANVLEARLSSATRLKDPLMSYRKYLELNDINPETDGWPSVEAYSEENIQAFIALRTKQ